MGPKEGIRLRPDLRAHALSDTEVALIGETERVALRGRPYVLLVPLLDGTRSEDELVEALKGSLPPEMVFYATSRLESSGYALRRTSNDDDSGWTAWWLAQGQRVDERIDAVDQARLWLSTVGLEPSFAQSLRSRLGASLAFAGTSEEASLEVCIVDDYLRPELRERAQRRAASGRALLPVRPVGVTLWFGPFCSSETAFDWDLFIERQKINRPADASVLALRGAFPIVEAIRAPETVELGLSVASMMITRCVSGDVPEVIDGAVWTIDTGSLETKSHSVPRRPEKTSKNGRDHIVKLNSAKKKFTLDGGHRVCPPEETLCRLESLVSPITGIVPDLTRVSTLAGVHVFSATQTRATDGASPRRNRILGRPSAAAGKGQTTLQARVSCIAEAVERYSCGFFGDETLMRTRIDQIDSGAIHPHDVLLFSDTQYARRAHSNNRYGDGFQWVPEPFHEDYEIDWTPVWSISHQRTRWVPSALCYFGFESQFDDGVPRFARADSNGCASGNTLEEAILQGLLELIERDACALWWYNRLRRRAINLASFRDPFVDEMTCLYESKGRSLQVLDVRNDLGVPAAVAVSWRTETRDRIHLGMGCHVEPRIAVSRALAEHNQCASIDQTETGESEDPEARRWFHEATVENQPYVEPLPEEPVHASELESLATEDIKTDITTCVKLVQERGHEILVLDQTRPEIGFPTVRVIIPGLRHFWARFAPGRLYDVPVAMGWLDQPKEESELNPIPFFL